MRTTLAILAIVLLVAACTQAPAPAPQPTAPSTPPAAAQAVDVSGVQNDLNQIDSLTNELNTSELDALDQDLNFG